MKKCTKCKVIKDYKEFRTRKASKDGLQSNCKECEKEQRRAHYLKNKEKVKASNKLYAKTYVRKTLTEEQKQKNKEKAKEYYIKNKERIKSLAKAYKKTLNGKYSDAGTSNKRRLLKTNNSDNTVTKESLDILMKVQKDCCYHCLEVLDKSIQTHLDHYVPISKGGAHSIYNVVWSCAKCNLEKADKMPKNPLRKEHFKLLKDNLNLN